MNIIAILVLGTIGGLLRFPFETHGLFGTLFVNLSGSLALGVTTEVFSKKSVPDWTKNGVNGGLIGSFTTFSAFASGSEHLASTRPWLALMYVVAMMGGGTLLAWTGSYVVHRFLQTQSKDNQQDAGENQGAATQPVFYRQQVETGD